MKGKQTTTRVQKDDRRETNRARKIVYYVHPFIAKECVRWPSPCLMFPNEPKYTTDQAHKPTNRDEDEDRATRTTETEAERHAGYTSGIKKKSKCRAEPTRERHAEVTLICRGDSLQHFCARAATSRDVRSQTTAGKTFGHETDGSRVGRSSVDATTRTSDGSAPSHPTTAFSSCSYRGYLDRQLPLPVARVQLPYPPPPGRLS